MKRKLVLQNGMEFVGHGFGSTKEVIAELVFNTSVVGYQEILSDPAYYDQMLCMTYPLIGNYGIIDEDYESKIFGPKALVVREYNDKPSNFRYTKTLNELLEENDVAGITHVDTRMITRVLRDEGSQLAMICDLELPLEEALAKMSAYQPVNQPVSMVSCKKVWYSRCPNPKFNVVIIDCGITYNIIRKLNQYGCNVTIVPYQTSKEKIMAMNPNGIVVSNGPGDPKENTEVIALIQQLQGECPMLGIGLGHQLIALANGLHTEKMKFGHHGGNHPVKNLINGKVETATQNHDYVVVEDEKMPQGMEITHRNLLDQSVEGFRIEKDLCYSIQYQPECIPGSTENFVYDQFVMDMQKGGDC
ncbi:MAG: carbamoyl phosphate synthase small subunit [Erysipelotrichaceae bacterium]|nr:carbamoyl phosphate synthase small subunit [Erysipelotrichaceae bacterium]